MNPQTENKKAPPTGSTPDYAPQNRLAVVYFTRAVNFGGVEMESASVPSKADLERGNRGSNAVDSIELAWLNNDCSIATGVDTKNPADGIVLRKRAHNLHNGKRLVLQTFIPWSGVRSFGYGE